jgi:hypothetical protein
VLANWVTNHHLLLTITSPHAALLLASRVYACLQFGQAQQEVPPAPDATPVNATLDGILGRWTSATG